MGKKFDTIFRFCPLCGDPSGPTSSIPFVCNNCDFQYYFSPTIAVGGIICDEAGRVLFIERAKDPGKGMLGLPGGFVDGGESGEIAVAREIYEEVGLIATKMTFLTTLPNTYDYKGVISDVLDLFYVCEVKTTDSIQAQESEVSSYFFAKPEETVIDKMAFESNKKALRKFAGLKANSSRTNR